MSNRRWPALACLLAALLSYGDAERGEAGDETEPRVEAPQRTLRETAAEFVELLRSPRRSERRDGERRLLELGPRVLPHLPATSRLDTAAEREAVRRIRRELELQAAKESVRASRVTFREETTLRGLLDAITQQTGNAFDVADVNEDRLSRSMTIDVRSAPFWQVVDEQLPAFGVRFDPESSGDAVVLVEGETAGGGNSSVSYFESFRVTTTPLRRRPLFGDDEHDLLRATIALHVEPRLQPLFARFRGDSLEVKDRAGGRLPPLSPTATLDTPVTEGRLSPRWDVRVRSGDDARSVSLRGAVVLTIAAGEEVIRFPSLDRTLNVARRRAGVSVTTTSVELGDDDAEAGRSATIGVTVSYDEGGPAFESHRTWVYHNEARLEDARGRSIAPNGPPTVRLGDDGTLAVLYRFDGLEGTAADHRFVYVAPTLVVDVPVAFSREDVPVASEATP